MGPASPAWAPAHIKECGRNVTSQLAKQQTGLMQHSKSENTHHVTQHKKYYSQTLWQEQT